MACPFTAKTAQQASSRREEGDELRRVKSVTEDVQSGLAGKPLVRTGCINHFLSDLMDCEKRRHSGPPSNSEESTKGWGWWRSEEEVNGGGWSMKKDCPIHRHLSSFMSSTTTAPSSVDSSSADLYKQQQQDSSSFMGMVQTTLSFNQEQEACCRGDDDVKRAESEECDDMVDEISEEHDDDEEEASCESCGRSLETRIDSIEKSLRCGKSHVQIRTEELLDYVICAERCAADARRFAEEAACKAHKAETTAVRARRLYEKLANPRKCDVSLKGKLSKKRLSLFHRRQRANQQQQQQAEDEGPSSATGFK